MALAAGFAWAMRLSCPVSLRRNAVWPVVWVLACASPLLATSSYRELVAPDTVQHDLKGAVKAVHEKTYKVGEDGRRELQQEKVVHFDREGYQSVELTVDPVALGRNTAEIRVYDVNLNWVRQETSYGTKLEIRLIETDPVKKRVTWRALDSAGQPTVTKEVTYGAFRKVTEGREFDAKGQPAQSYRVTRDARGLGKELVFMDAGGRVKYRSVPTWNERGFMIGSVDEFLDGKSTAVRKFEPVTVDAAGNWTEQSKTGKFVEKNGKYPAQTEVVVRVIEYYE